MREGSGHETYNYTVLLESWPCLCQQKKAEKACSLKLPLHSPGYKMCHDECSEAQERDDQSNIRETLQDYTIHRRVGGTSEILGMYVCM